MTSDIGDWKRILEDRGFWRSTSRGCQGSSWSVAPEEWINEGMSSFSLLYKVCYSSVSYAHLVSRVLLQYSLEIQCFRATQVTASTVKFPFFCFLYTSMVTSSDNWLFWPLSIASGTKLVLYRCFREFFFAGAFLCRKFCCVLFFVNEIVFCQRKRVSCSKSILMYIITSHIQFHLAYVFAFIIFRTLAGLSSSE